MDQYLGIVSRWVHIASAVTVVGGFVYARLVVVPAMRRDIGPDAHEALSEALAARFRWIFYTAVALLLVSGVYNLMSKKSTTVLYHAIIGVKLLLALHVFAAGFLAVQPKNPRRARQMTGIVVSGLVILALSAVLRYISLTAGSLTGVSITGGL